MSTVELAVKKVQGLSENEASALLDWLEQQKPRRDRQNTGSAAGTDVHSKNQGRQEGQGVTRDARSEKGDARRPNKG